MEHFLWTATGMKLVEPGWANPTLYVRVRDVEARIDVLVQILSDLEKKLAATLT